MTKGFKPQMEREDLPVWRWAEFEHRKRKGLSMRMEREDLPVWRWAELVEGILAEFPPDIPLENMPGAFRNAVASSAEGKAAEAEPENERRRFYYAEVKTQFCVDDDLSFCECLARAHHRLSEDRGERIFLRGNIFMAKLAKAVFEQDGEIFAEACEKYKDEAYFNECAETLRQWNFVVDRGKKLTKESWLGLYEVVLLLTGEYLATKCDLPKVNAFECSENSEGAETLEIIAAGQNSSEADLDGAALQPIMIGSSFGVDSMDDSSDCIKAGELFHEFLGENFPFKDNQSKLAEFMRNIYGRDVCGDLDWLRKDIAKNSLPRPKVKVDAMEKENMLGSHEGETICLNQRLVLDAVSSKEPGDCFILFIVMLIEYGHFLNEVLHSKANKSVDDSKKIGRTFAYWFVEYSDADFFNKDFEFADFTAPDAKGEEHKFTVKVSGLSRECRREIFHTLGVASTWEGEV